MSEVTNENENEGKKNVNNEGKKDDQSNGGESVNERLLRESKENKAKAQSLQAQLDEINKKKLEEEGNYKSLLDQEKKRSDDLAKDALNLKRKTLKANISATVAKFANDVVDFEDLMNQKKFSKILEEGIDEDGLTISEESAEKYVKAVLEAKPHLKKTPTRPGSFGGGKPNYGQDASYKDLSSRDKTNLKFQLANQKK